MSQRNTGSFTQFPRINSVNITTSNGGSLTAPTNTGLLYVAGPDGADIWGLALTATATQTSANTGQIYTSQDYGSTFQLQPIAPAFAAGAAVSSVVNGAMPNGVPMGPTNPFVLGGAVGPFTNTMAQSSLTEAINYYVGQTPTGGAADVQTLPLAFNTSNTQLGASPATGTILDFTAGFTNATTTPTLAPGLQAANVVKRFDGSAVAAGDITKNFRYRAVYNGTNWLLLPTTRLYVAMSQSQALTATAFGCDR